MTDKPLYRLIDKDGNDCGTFKSAAEAAFTAKRLWPREQQREDDAPGWDIEAVPSTD